MGKGKSHKGSNRIVKDLKKALNEDFAKRRHETLLLDQSPESVKIQYDIAALISRIKNVKYDLIRFPNNFSIQSKLKYMKEELINLQNRERKLLEIDNKQVIEIGNIN